MVGKLRRVFPWPRRMVVNLAIILVMPLAVIAYWQKSPVRNAEEGSRLQPTDADGKTDPSIDTQIVQNRAPTGPKHPTTDILRSEALARLHADATFRFVSSPSNGAGRLGMTFYPAAINHTKNGQLGQNPLSQPALGLADFLWLAYADPHFPGVSHG